MGSPFAPAYANIFMAYLWNNAIAPQLPRPVWLKRFLDDIIALLFTPVVTEDILSLLNSVHSSTKFTLSDASQSQSFLDAMVSILHGKLHTDLYSKPTDAHKFLSPTSCHPKHVFRSVVYSGALRIRRICSRDDFFSKRIAEFRGYLINSGYRERFIDPIIEKAVREDRKLLLAKKKDDKSSDRVLFVTTFDPRMFRVNDVHNRLKPVLDLSDRMKKVLPSPPLVALRRPPNLGNAVIRTRRSSQHSAETSGVTTTTEGSSFDIHTTDNITVESSPSSLGTGDCANDIVRVAVQSTPSASAPPCQNTGPICTPGSLPSTQTVGHMHCGQGRCLICRLHRVEGATVTSCKTGAQFRLRHKLDCNSSCVIYTIICAKCNVQYVGKTVTRLRTRFNNHKSTIRKRGDGTVDKHFSLPDHDIGDVRIQAIDRCSVADILSRETWWIHRLKSLKITDGLNVDPGVTRLQNSLNN